MGTPVVLNRAVYFRAALRAAVRKMKPTIRETTTRQPELLQRNQIQAYKEYHENNIVNLSRYESIRSKYKS